MIPTNVAIIAGGKDRLEEARVEAVKRRRAQVREEVESRYAEDLRRAGALWRWLLRVRIRREVAAILRREFPVWHAHYLHWR